MSEAYRNAGVDIDAGEEVVQRISSHVKRTTRPGVLGGIGGFGAMFQVPSTYQNPVLVSGTDGVGTKLLVAHQLNNHRSIGIDLVAMCVNDIVTMGAEPLFFLDYFATGKLAPNIAEEVVAGIADGCVDAGCALIGGETAEMPGMYGAGHYDLAGFCVGVVEKDKIIDGSRVQEGQAVIGFLSSGLHSNGYSLARKICAELDWSKEYDLGASLGEVLLRPTIIYVQTCLAIQKRYDVFAFAHITGGGITDNIPRVLPEGLGVCLDADSWEMPPIFGLLQREGTLSLQDMRRTFNCGLGLIAIVPESQANAICNEMGGFKIGKVISCSTDRVQWK
jgi:phosphoribosylformylglycinamidine cyclo-ligase